MELDGWTIVRPFEPVQPTLRPSQALLHLAGVGHAEHRKGRVAKEDELATGPQEARRFGDPFVGIAPDRGAVLGDREIELCIRKTRRFGVGLDQLEPEPVLFVEPSRGVELRRGDVDADDPARAASLEPRGDVGGPAAELDDVFPNHVREDVHFRFGRIPEAPADLLLGPGMFRSGVGIPRVVLGPVRAVDADVIGFRIPHGNYFRVRSHWTMSLIC